MWAKKTSLTLLVGIMGLILVCFTAINKRGDKEQGSQNFDIFRSETLKIKTIGPPIGNLKIKASGLVYWANQNTYLLISDNTKKKEPMLFVMTHDGLITQTLAIKGLKKIDDLESICQDENGNLYLACSLSRNKKGKRPKSRRLFVKVTPKGGIWTSNHQVLLYDCLKEVLQNSGPIEWTEVSNSGSAPMNINIEGIFYNKNDLYLGFKEPLKNDNAVILKIKDVDALFKTQHLTTENLTLWHAFPLHDPETGMPTGISDLCLHAESLYILSYGKFDKKDAKVQGVKRISLLWKFNLKNETLTCLSRFNNLKAEGIAFNPAARTCLITFDQGRKKASRFIILETAAL